MKIILGIIITAIFFVGIAILLANYLDSNR